MGVESNKAWRPLDRAGIAVVAGHMGVFELADAAGVVQYIGCASGRSRFGLRGELDGWLARTDCPVQYRTEVTTAYLTRWLELLMAHQARHGRLPALNPASDGQRLGRLSVG